MPNRMTNIPFTFSFRALFIGVEHAEWMFDAICTIAIIEDRPQLDVYNELMDTSTEDRVGSAALR